MAKNPNPNGKKLNDALTQKMLRSVIANLTPGSDAPEYRYAEALLIVFNLKAAETDDLQALHFNRADLYELVTGLSSGKVELSAEELRQFDDPSADISGLVERLRTISSRRTRKSDMQKLMPKVSDALTLNTLREKHGRTLLIAEYEVNDWVAIDLGRLKSKTADF